MLIPIQRTLKIATIALPLNYLNNFQRSVELPLSNCKIELKLKWRKYCVLSAAGNDNTNANPNNIILTIKNTKLYVPTVTLKVKDNQKLSKPLSKEIEGSIYWNKYKTKRDKKNTPNEYRYEPDFIGVDKLVILVYSNQDFNSRRFKTRRYYFTIIKNQIIMKNYNIIIHVN